MKWWDYILVAISALCTIFSIVGAVKSNKYFKKSKELTIYANTNVAYIEIEKIITTLTSMLKFENPTRTKRGFNALRLVSENAESIKYSLNTLRKNLSDKDYQLIQGLLSPNGINVEQYLDSIITGSAFPDGIIIWNNNFNTCQQTFREMQIQIKSRLDIIQESLK